MIVPAFIAEVLRKLPIDLAIRFILSKAVFNQIFFPLYALFWSRFGRSVAFIT